MDPSQVPHGVVFTVAKRVLPQGVKDAIKPILRAVRLLPPDQTPAVPARFRGWEIAEK